MTLAEAHAQLAWRGLQLRGLYAMGWLDDAARLSALQDGRRRARVARRAAATLEAAYDVLGLALPDSGQSLSPFVRYEVLDLHDEVPSGLARDPALDQTLWTAGLTYKPIPTVVVKADYQRTDTDADDAAGAGELRRRVRVLTVREDAMHRPRPASIRRAALLAAALLLRARAPAAARSRGRRRPRSAPCSPRADAIEAKDVILTDEMVGADRAARAFAREGAARHVLHGSPGRRRSLGYAVIHSHVVRTKRETLVHRVRARRPDPQDHACSRSSSPRSTARAIAGSRSSHGKGPADRLAVGQDLAPISGATLTARGVAEESRWLLQALREAMGVGR